MTFGGDEAINAKWKRSLPRFKYSLVLASLRAMPDNQVKKVCEDERKVIE